MPDLRTGNEASTGRKRTWRTTTAFSSCRRRGCWFEQNVATTRWPSSRRLRPPSPHLSRLALADPPLSSSSTPIRLRFLVVFAEPFLCSRAFFDADQSVPWTRVRTLRRRRAEKQEERGGRKGRQALLSLQTKECDGCEDVLLRRTHESAKGWERRYLVEVGGS
jgi:hypothetical protein